MSTIKYTSTIGLPEIQHTATGRIGKIVNHHPIDEIGEMYELAFDGQIYTECYWESELTKITSGGVANGNN